MWVVKIGGSLCEADAPAQAGGEPAYGPAGGEPRQLPSWLEVIARLGGGRVAIVPGGGSFADEVRRAQLRWGIDDLAAHNMAVLAMAQTAHLLLALQPGLRLARSDGELRAVLRSGRAALWLPFDAMRAQPDLTTHWGMSSDSLALALACRLNAERLVLVKRRCVPFGSGPADWSRSGIVDTSFPALAEDAAFPIDVMHESDPLRLGAELIGEARLPL